METEQEKHSKNSRDHLKPFGNWCNHISHAPKFYLQPEQHGTRPDVLVEAQESLEQFYWQPKSYLEHLILTRDSNRQQRTEAREAVSKVLGVILHYLDLATMRVGVPNEDGSFHSFTMKDIALRIDWRTRADNKDPKLKDKGVKRVWRAMKVLKKAGYISISKRCKKVFEEEQKYRGLPAIRCVMTSLFHDLKVSVQKLDMRRKQATNRLKRRYHAYLAKIEAELKKKGKQGLNALLGLVQFNKNLNPPRKGRELTRQQQALVTMEARLKAEGKLPNTS